MGRNRRKIIAYIRVSTAHQGRSGLGLEAQRAAVVDYCSGTDSEIVREFVEVESGRNDERPKLAEALAFARRAKATLCVAKLDRLSRSVRFIATVLDSGVEFTAADFPEANRLMLHVLAAVAEYEARQISCRTRGALAAAKARGVRLGTHDKRVPILSNAARRKGQSLGARANRLAAIAGCADLLPVMANLRNAGCSFAVIAKSLNNDGHMTRSAKPWSPVAVMRCLQRAA
jgi:DNA invertase Pin-like site-specific DNA recombinase